MTAPQTPGPVRPPDAGPGPLVPAPPCDDAPGGAGDPATIVRRFRDSVDEMFELHTEQRLARLAAEHERDEARAEVERLSALLVQAEDYAREAGDREAGADQDCDTAMVRAERADAAVERVRALHSTQPGGVMCTGCLQLAPCLTIAALATHNPGGGT